MKINRNVLEFRDFFRPPPSSVATEDAYVLQTAQLEEGGNNLFPLFFAIFLWFLVVRKVEVRSHALSLPSRSVNTNMGPRFLCRLCSLDSQAINRELAESQFWFLVRVEVAGFFLSSPHLVISSRILVLVKSPAHTGVHSALLRDGLARVRKVHGALIRCPRSEGCELSAGRERRPYI